MHVIRIEGGGALSRPNFVELDELQCSEFHEENLDIHGQGNIIVVIPSA